MKKYLNSVEEVVELLKEGQLITSKLTNRVYQMSNGIIYSTYKGNATTINDSIYFSENVFYTEEPEPLKFEVNRVYKTRKGLKAFLVKICNQHNHMFFLSSEKFVNSPAYCFETNGDGVCVENGFYKKNLKEFDIVALWEEEK